MRVKANKIFLGRYIEGDTVSGQDKINSFLIRGEVGRRNSVKVAEMISMLEIQYMFSNRITRLSFFFYRAPIKLTPAQFHRPREQQ